MGISFGSNIIAKALGGECERMSQNCFIGKEQIELQPHFLTSPYCRTTLYSISRKVTDPVAKSIRKVLETTVILSSH